MRLTGAVMALLMNSAMLPGQGIITTMAGNPYAACGPPGDGGPATSAELCDEQSPAVDTSGNVYFTTTATFASARSLLMASSARLLETAFAAYQGTADPR